MVATASAFADRSCQVYSKRAIGYLVL